MIKKICTTATTIFLFTTVTISQKNEEKAVADAVEQMRLAMIDGDKVRLENIAANTLSYGHSSGVIDDKRSFVDKIVTGASDFISIDLSEQTISISNKTAIVRHVLRAETNEGGKPGEVNLRVLLVWQKQKAGWKLLARQAVRIA